MSRMDHPRIRGEHDVDSLEDVDFWGSSPHTRGAPRSTRRHPRRGGIIPAYAGSTSVLSVELIRYPDHPRIRGEHEGLGRWSLRDTGSSPHTRGAHLNANSKINRHGIIPAYAGSTVKNGTFSTGIWDHPRIRGEHSPRWRPRRTQSGSSPHTRGAPKSTRPKTTSPRIIPAYAGSTLYRRRLHRARQDHPRIRGEHSGAALSFWRRKGSSPHTRGAQPRESPGGLSHRIIPAYAGSTSVAVGSCPRSWDHPRIRGEHITVARNDGSQKGSSPHTRGARRPWFIDARGWRIIPAYAGSTRLPRGSPRGPGDHPRIRGEHWIPL